MPQQARKLRDNRFERQFPRHDLLTEEINGLITAHDQHIPFIIWDISDDGLGLWVSSTLQPGTELNITIGKPYLVELGGHVKWCEQQKSVPGYRCGVIILPEFKDRIAPLLNQLAAKA